MHCTPTGLDSTITHNRDRTPVLKIRKICDAVLKQDYNTIVRILTMMAAKTRMTSILLNPGVPAVQSIIAKY